MTRRAAIVYFAVVLAGVTLCSPAARAVDAVAEIEYLLSAVGTSGCKFVRNGKPHDARDAADHLRMKYDRYRKHAKRAEQFISRLASKSSMSGKPYRIHCPGDDPVDSGDWLLAKLAGYREAAATAN